VSGRDRLSAAEEEQREAFEEWFPCDRYLLTRVRTGDESGVRDDEALAARKTESPHLLN
jgi:hypothetical protein